MTKKQVGMAMGGYIDKQGKMEKIRQTIWYQKAVAAIAAGPQKLTGYVKGTFKFYLKPDPKTGELPNKRGDLDNYIKACVDGLQYGGIFAPKTAKALKGNDKMLIRYGEDTGIYAGDIERTEIIIEEL